MASFLTGIPPVAAAASETGSGPGRDCRSCELRSRCISYGWMSPAGLWFENAVVLRPPAGCRGYVGRSADIFDHFGTRPGSAGARPPGGSAETSTDIRGGGSAS